MIWLSFPSLLSLRTPQELAQNHSEQFRITTGLLRTPQDPLGPLMTPQDSSGALKTAQDHSEQLKITTGPLRTPKDP